MKALARYVRLYVLIASQYVKARMSYRADFIISSFGMVFAILPGFLGLLVIFNNIPRLAGWSLPELALIYGFSLLACAPLQLFFDHIWELRWQVQSGKFIKYYFRPLNMMFYYMSETVDLKGLSQLVMGIAFVAWASIQIGIDWTAARIFGFASLLLCGSLVMIGLMVLAASTSFWIVNSFSILMLVSRFRDYARYPMSIFNGLFRFIFTAVIPIGFVGFYPIQWVLRPDAGVIVPYFAPLVGFGLFFLSYVVWTRGTRSWSGTGT
jgi:ABC-2 type transport system permease protein